MIAAWGPAPGHDHRRHLRDHRRGGRPDRASRSPPGCSCGYVKAAIAGHGTGARRRAGGRCRRARHARRRAPRRLTALARGVPAPAERLGRRRPEPPHFPKEHRGTTAQQQARSAARRPRHPDRASRSARSGRAPTRPPLGLDLRGGTQVILTPTTAEGARSPTTSSSRQSRSSASAWTGSASPSRRSPPRAAATATIVVSMPGRQPGPRSSTLVQHRDARLPPGLGPAARPRPDRRRDHPVALGESRGVRRGPRPRPPARRVRAQPPSPAPRRSRAVAKPERGHRRHAPPPLIQSTDNNAALQPRSPRSTARTEAAPRAVRTIRPSRSPPAPSTAR